MTRIVFLGTPEAAIPTLATLTREFDVGLVITQPDRPRGRSGTPTPPPVKMFGVESELEVAQPSTSAELFSNIEDAGRFDVGVVVAYGRILSSALLALPSAGFVNVHFSLLPRWRGAAPVERALIAGDTMTGVTVIKIDEGVDTGPVLTAQAVDINHEEDGGGLTSRLADLGGRLIVPVLAGYTSGSVVPLDQSEEGASYAHKISADDRLLANSSSATDFVNRVRGLAPTPAATLQIDGQPHKILQARRHDHAPAVGTWVVIESVLVLGVDGEGVELVSLQPSGKTVRSGADWIRGKRRENGVFS